ncbi:MAG: WD40 repeat domain-containing protein [Bernardetiaceae bacterium]|jgi:hypothetical protein|nr:WD40 repeat domain-containing protein [Bernardetiaceae bacterium]
MRTELEQMALIERYLQGAMGQAEQQQFEAKLANDPALRQELALQKLLVKAVERQGLKEELAALHAQLYPAGPAAATVPPRPNSPPARARWLRPRNLALAAMLTLGAGLCEVPLPPQWRTESSVVASAPAFTPTFAGFDVPFQTLEVEAGAGRAFRLASGSQVRVPAGAFVDQRGQPVAGQVQLRYREFHQAAEIIASGIPMEYQNGVFESGGMFELRGQQGGVPVYIAPGKRIEVKLASFTDDPGFKHYYLEEPAAPPLALNGLGLVPTAHAQDARLSTRWLELGPTNIEPNIFKKNRLDSLVKIRLAQAQAKAQAANGGDGDGPASALPATTPLDNRWEFRLQVSAKKPESDTLNLQAVMDGKGRVQLVPRQRPRMANPSKQLRQKTAFLQFLADNPLIWRYAGRLAAEEHPNLARNRWVLDQTWTSVHLQAPLFVPKRRLTPQGPSPQTQPRFVAFSPDSRLMLLGRDGQVELWNTQGGLLHTFRGYHFATFAPHAPQVLLANAQEAHLADFSGQAGVRYRASRPTKFSRLEFSADGQRVLGFGTDEVVRVWQQDGTLISQLKDSRKSWFVEATFNTADGKQVLAQAHDGEVLLYNDSGQVIDKPGQFPASVPKFGLPDPSLRARADRKTFTHWARMPNKRGDSVQINQRKVISALYILQNDLPVDWLRLDDPRQQIVQAHFAPDGQALVVSADDGHLYLWQRNLSDSVQRMELANDQYSFVTHVRKANPQPLLANSRPAARKLDSLLALYLAEAKAQNAEEQAKLEAEANVLRTFGVEKFGVYNIDRLYHDPAVVAVQATLDLGTPALNQQLADQGARAYYLTGARGNVVIRLFPSDLRRLPLSPQGQNQLLVLLPGQRVARYGPAEFAKLDWAQLRLTQQCDFRFTVAPQPVQSLAQWQALLGQASTGAPNG